MRRRDRDIRGEIMATAQELFFNRGYEKTQVDEIIGKVRISKGSFYRYFKSKENLLSCVVREIIDPGCEALELIVRSDLGALDKLNSVFAFSSQWKADNLDALKFIVRSFWTEESVLLRHKLISWTSHRMRPIFISILAQGKEEGVFDLDEPEDVADVVFYFGNVLGESMVNLILSLDDDGETVRTLRRKIELNNRVIEKILAVPAGSIKTFDLDNLVCVI